MGYEFEWDSNKAASNLRKHGVSFNEAVTVFSDPFSLLMANLTHSIDEQRFLILGRSCNHRLLVVSFSDRSSRTRIITARLASRRERHDYEEDTR